MKKGQKINKVEITNGHMVVIKTDGCIAKLSRKERKVLENYNSTDYEEQIKRVFSNPDILTENFTVINNGVPKYVHK